MKAIYSDFLNENRKCGRDLETNDTAKALFSLLSKDRNIIAMIDAADAGKPAISPVALIVESYCERHYSPDFDLANEQRRTVVGSPFFARYGIGVFLKDLFLFIFDSSRIWRSQARQQKTE